MLISNITLELTNSDIEAIIKNFIPKDNINISSISLDNIITLKGSLPLKGFTFPFSCELKIISYFSSTLKINISSFSALNMMLPTKIKDLALKNLISLISYKGITINDRLIVIDLKKLSDTVDFTSIDVVKCASFNNTLYLTLNNIKLKNDLEELLSHI